MSNVTKLPLPTLKTIADQQLLLVEGMTLLVERQNEILAGLTVMMKHMGELAERQEVIAAAIMGHRKAPGSGDGEGGAA